MSDGTHICVSCSEPKLTIFAAPATRPRAAVAILHQLVAVEEAFRNLKGDPAIRPIFHQDEKQIEAHIFIAFLADCMQVALTRRLHALVSGLTAHCALESSLPCR